MPRSVRLGLIAMSSALALLAGSAAAEEPRRPSEAELLDAFMQVVTPEFRRWERPVRIALMGGQLRDPEKLIIRQQVSELRRITRHDIAVVTDGRINALIVVSDDPYLDLEYDPLRSLVDHLLTPTLRAELRAKRGQGTCYDYTAAGDEGLALSIVGIMANLGEDLFRHCVVRKLARLLGFGADLSVDWSVLNWRTDFQTLSADDRILLRVLYDPRLRPGMSPTQLRATARPLLRDARAQR